ncbi:MAG: SRPBCC family protein [Candidatus Omnitrophota bacterium]
MPVDGLFHIHISRVIPSELWRVVRLITRVKDFPDFVPTVKEVTVLEKSRNRMRTSWSVMVDKVPIRWVEEDTLDLANNKILFNAVEGDLQVFRGVWTFGQHPNGTDVSVDVYLKVGIPAIGEFADNFVTKLLTRNFEAILEAMERHLISTKYQSSRQGVPDKIAGFGVIGHFYNYTHLENCFKMLNPGVSLPSREFLGQIFHLTPSFKLYDIDKYVSKTGDTTNGCFIVATFVPDMIEKDMWAIFSKVVRACKIAEKHGVGVVTLGGFTSIVAERIGREISAEVDVAVTTGNTFAAVMAVDGVMKAARLLELDLAASNVAIIGGTGDIGSACARTFVDKTKQVTITGRTKENLKKMRDELVKRRAASVVATTDNRAAVQNADIVITAASSTASILDASWFKPGAIICDVGYPKNVSYAPVTREDILIFSGGLATTPTQINFPVDAGLPATNAIYGCFAEAIILALEKRYENFSFGRGNITLEKMEDIRSMGKKHGFEVADFYWGHRLVNQQLLETLKRKVHERPHP